jgi:hypothetical protein
MRGTSALYAPSINAEEAADMEGPMMHDSLGWIVATLIGLAWTLGYAVRTLCGLRRKTFYPLLRLRTKDGHCLPVVTAANVSPALPPAVAFGYPW